MAELQTLIHLQEYDTKIAALETEAVRLPKQIETIQASLAEARKSVETVKARVEQTRKDLRAKEKDLDDIAAKRQKSEARLWEVKNNTEYSAVLVEIETIKSQKARIEEELLGLMEMQERLAVEVREAEARHKTREEQARQDEGVVRKKLAAVEVELTGIRGERATLAGELPRNNLADYEKILKAKAGLAIVSVSTTAICGGCRVTMRPQVLQELKAAAELVRCESCGRFLYWQDTP
ncbi:MAG: hypothetical protein HY217_09835 [Candidatus Rokubacteria bacterium]|nr:hypothetical protein [Candidatus Rokubacteria bacterium]